MEEEVRKREQNMLTRCVSILNDYNILSVNETKDFMKRIDEMPK